MMIESDARCPVFVSQHCEEVDRLTLGGARYMDTIDVVLSLGKGDAESDPVVACILCGCAASTSSDHRDCLRCHKSYCTSCVWPEGDGCRSCNDSSTRQSEAISRHPFGRCGDDSCCGTGETAIRLRHFCYLGCYGYGYSNGIANHDDDCPVGKQMAHVEYDHKWFCPHGPKICAGETRLPPTFHEKRGQFEGLSSSPDKE